jgi:hypothetical protein
MLVTVVEASLMCRYTECQNISSFVKDISICALNQLKISDFMNILIFIKTGSNIWSQVPEWVRHEDILTD